MARRPVTSSHALARSTSPVAPAAAPPAISAAAQALGYLRVWQAAEYLGCAASTLNKMRVSGNGPPFGHVGRTVVYRQHDLDAWVEKSIRLSTSERGAR